MLDILISQFVNYIPHKHQEDLWKCNMMINRDILNKIDTKIAITTTKNFDDWNIQSQEYGLPTIMLYKYLWQFDQVIESMSPNISW